MNVSDDALLNPLHISLISAYIDSVNKYNQKYIPELLAKPGLSYLVHEHFPNGLTPLDVARQFRLNSIADLIEQKGGKPGIWADIPKDYQLLCGTEVLGLHESMSRLCACGPKGKEVLKYYLSKLSPVKMESQSRAVMTSPMSESYSRSLSLTISKWFMVHYIW